VSDPAAGRVAVVCVGNTLMGDEGLGPRVAHAMEKGYTYPEGTTVVDAGCC
jgi:hydrogenase maturation protease